MHYHMAREYVGQLMKNNYSCKNRKHEKAAKKIREQWGELRDLFVDMVLNSVLPLKHQQQLPYLQVNGEKQERQ